MSRMPERLRALALFGALTTAAATQAAPALLEGELGDWLDRTVTPELQTTLSRHPMFTGQTIRFASLRNGRPQSTSNELNEAVERRLTQGLLEAEGVRLAVERPARPCEVPQPVDYVIGIEIAPTGRREAALNLAIIDVAESVWVSGISFQWRGRLSTSERLALATPITTAHPGSADSPLALADADTIARTMRERLRCVLPHGLDGPVYLNPPDDPHLARIGRALQSTLLTSPVAAITTDAEAARWVLELDRLDADARLQEVQLNLQDSTGSATQRLAAVFVSGPESRAGPQQRPAAAAAPPALLSALSMRPAEAVGVCDRHSARVNTCVEVEFELRRAAYLMVFTTQSQRVQGLSCDRAPERSEAGPRRYRLRVPPGRVPPATDGVLNAVGNARRPDAGLYVLATRDSGVARRLHEVLRRAPGTCAADASSHEAWLRNLQQVTDAQATQLEWRAIHVAHETEGVVQL